MKITEIKQDLFEMNNEYVLAHCISKDCAMGAGIAKTFTKKYPELKCQLKEHIDEFGIEICECLFVETKDDRHSIINMITKENYWDKPTVNNFNKTVDELALICELYDIRKLAIPKIGCGLDKLNWKDVKNKIESAFKNTDVEIIVCYL